MRDPFDAEEAKKFLSDKHMAEREANETLRQEFLQKTIDVLREHFAETNIKVFLVGSVTRPYQFNTTSDIDVVLRGFTGDRFEVWSQLESQIGRPTEVILYENCDFKEHVDQEGLRVM